MVPKGAGSSPVCHPPVDSLLVYVDLAQLEIPTTRCGALLMQPVVRQECSRAAICVLSANFKPAIRVRNACRYVLELLQV